MTNNNLTDERLSALIRVARDSLELYEMELPVIDDVMLALAELQQRRAAMINHSEGARDMVEPVSQPYKLPSQSSDAVNEAAWKLHDTLTEHGPLNGHQFNNLKGCFYEALKVAMRNSPVIPDGWQLVPVDPTLEMIKSGANAASNGMLIPGMYRAMLAAAPQQEGE
ncbi:hypothetical protein [Escherichia coli]|uniref:hypothetical protein n=1 Tax=Escherichia coli TaxID=562 RepID=UPI001FCEE4FC|nr:hypothetical protein [Escherichia coli]